jgi:GAF domain-containing protein
MEPIPETLEALAELDAFIDDGALLDELRRRTELARRVAPGLVGASVAYRDHGVTFTLVATSEEIAALDGVQYLASGPCVDAISDGDGRSTTSDDLFDEPRWQAFARATAAAGVRSTLTFPVLDGSEVIGTVNLYGRDHDTFVGRHRALARAFAAFAPGVVTNADLPFSTRRAAERAPEQLRDERTVDTAIGIVAGSDGVSLDTARARLADAARRAGVPVVTLARVVVETYNARP